jgi:hypothetical protein
MIALIEGRVLSVSELHRETAWLGRTFPTCRSELELLATYGLVVLKPAPNGARRTLVYPTKKLVAFYDENLTSLVEEVRSILSEHPQRSPPGTPNTPM